MDKMGRRRARLAKMLNEACAVASALPPRMVLQGCRGVGFNADRVPVSGIEVAERQPRTHRLVLAKWGRTERTWVLGSVLNSDAPYLQPADDEVTPGEWLALAWCLLGLGCQAIMERATPSRSTQQHRRSH